MKIKEVRLRKFIIVRLNENSRNSLITALNLYFLKYEKEYPLVNVFEM